MAKIRTGADLNPTVEIKVATGKVIVSVGEGFYEVYIDKAIQKAPYNYQTREYTVDPGDHRFSVYSAGRMIFDEVMHVPAEGEAAFVPEEPATETPPAAEEPEQNAGEPIPEPPGTNPPPYVKINRDTVHLLAEEMRDISATLESLLADPAAWGE